MDNEDIDAIMFLITTVIIGFMLGGYFFKTINVISKIIIYYLL